MNSKPNAGWISDLKKKKKKNRLESIYLEKQLKKKLS